MRVLVTGHRGYLGQPLCTALLTRGHEVRGLDADLFSHCDYAPTSENVEAVPWIRKDIRDVCENDLRGFDSLIHLAGLSNDPLGNLDPELTMAINHRAAVRVAEIAKAAGVARMLLASSCSVYGASDDSVLDESARLAPATPYAKSKLAMEQDIARLAGSNFSPVFLRSGTIYGLAPRIRFDLVVNNLTAWACATGKVLLKSDGSAWRPVVHVCDVARVFTEILELPAERVHGRAINVADDEQNARIFDLARKVAEIVTGAEISVENAAFADIRNYRVTGRTLRRLIGPWRAIALDDGIAELAAALIARPVPVSDFEGPRFQRLAYLKAQIAAGDLDQDLRLKSNIGTVVP